MVISDVFYILCAGKLADFCNRIDKMHPHKNHVHTASSSYSSSLHPPAPQILPNNNYSYDSMQLVMTPKIVAMLRRNESDDDDDDVDG